MSKDKKSFEGALNEAIQRIFGEGLVGVEVVNVPEGKTIEEVMAKRGFKPMEEDTSSGGTGLCPVCGEKHAGADQMEHHRLAAIKTIEKRIKACHDMAELWQRMHTSLSTPLEERKSLHVLDEIMLAKRIHELQRI